MDCNYCGDTLSSTAPSDAYRMRREDSKFCDDACRVKYHNARRKLARKMGNLRKLQSEIFELKRELEWDPTS